MSLVASPPEGAYDKYLSARSALVFLLQQAAEAGILDASPTPRSAADMAQAADADPSRVAILCATLASYGILEQSGQKFAVSDRFRELVPAQAIPTLAKVLGSEGARLGAEMSGGSARSQTDAELEMLMGEFRAIAYGSKMGEWLSGPLEPGALPPLEELFVRHSNSYSGVAEAVLAGPGVLAPAPATGATVVPASASLQLFVQCPPTDGRATEIKTVVRDPAVWAPVRQAAVPTVSAAALVSAFARTWPLGPLGFGVRVEGATRALRSRSHNRDTRVIQAQPIRSPKTRGLRYRIGTGLWVVAALCLLWAVWDLWGTGIGQARAQEQLKAEFASALAAAPASDPEVPSSVPGDAPAPVSFRDASPKPVVGSSVALMKIPAIDLEEIILEGTAVKDLRRGPGRYIGTSYPGQAGNAAIAGHRTTYGAPFFKIGKLKPGDSIEVTTINGKFVYQVDRLYRVEPDDNSPLEPSTDNLLTLTTCDPPFSAAKRLIVVAKLQGKPSVVPPESVAPQSVPVESVAPAPAPLESVAPGLDLRAFQQGSTPTQPEPSPAASPSPVAAELTTPATEPPTTTTFPPATQPPTTQPVFVPAPTQAPATEPPQTQPAQTQPPQTQAPQTEPSQTQPPTAPPVLGECSDGIDNDNDGKIDLEDKASCHGDPSSDE
ncbi:MAG: sortase [Actinomycetota bacterium]